MLSRIVAYPSIRHAQGNIYHSYIHILAVCKMFVTSPVAQWYCSFNESTSLLYFSGRASQQLLTCNQKVIGLTPVGRTSSMLVTLTEKYLAICVSYYSCIIIII